jgi:hypothetical protein
MTGSTLSTLPINNYTFGQNTYDEINQHYYILCSNGALVLNALTGNTIAMVPYYGAGMEHAFIASLPEPPPPPGQPIGIQPHVNHLAPFIFPNPGDGHFYIANTDEEMVIVVTDGFGKQLLSRNAKAESDQIDLSEYPPGIYLYTLSKNSQPVLKGKLIVR